MPLKQAEINVSASKKSTEKEIQHLFLLFFFDIPIQS